MPAPSREYQLSADELVKSLVANPAEPAPDVKVVEGWVGQSNREGFWRLYPTPELDDWIEIHETDVLLSKPISEQRSPLGGTVLVIKASAQLHSPTSTTVTAQTAFLEGDITATFAPASVHDLEALMLSNNLANKDYTKGFWCNVSMFFSCTTHVVRNPVCTLASGKLCGTRRFL